MTPEQLPKCHEANCMSNDMVEIGGIGKDVHYSTFDGTSSGIREIKLYQCKTCKKVELV